MFLNAHSWFSFQYGVMKPEALLEEAQKAGVRTLALTDINCTSGIPDFVRDAHRFEVRPVAGIEFRQRCAVVVHRHCEEQRRLPAAERIAELAFVG